MTTAVTSWRGQERHGTGCGHIYPYIYIYVIYMSYICHICVSYMSDVCHRPSQWNGILRNRHLVYWIFIFPKIYLWGTTVVSELEELKKAPHFCEIPRLKVTWFVSILAAKHDSQVTDTSGDQLGWMVKKNPGSGLDGWNPIKIVVHPTDRKWVNEPWWFQWDFSGKSSTYT